METSTLSRIISLDGDIITVDFDAMQNMTPEEKLRAMISAGGYNWANSKITPEIFPVEGTGIRRFRPKLFDFGRPVYPDPGDAVATMKSENSLPATHVHGFAYGATFPKEQRRYRIACLGSSAQVSGNRSVVYLGGDNNERDLNLYDWYGYWLGRWRFLGVQEVSGT